MKITNETRYDTRQLRSLVVAVYRDLVEPVEKAAWWWGRLHVKVAYRRRNAYCPGYAYLNGGPIRLLVNRPRQVLRGCLRDGQPIELKAQPIRELAATIAHELMHCYGYRHGQWHDAWEVAPLVVQFGERLIHREPVAKPKRDLPQVRYERVLSLERDWQVRAKRAATRLRRLRQQRRYYERALAARAGT